MAREIAVGTRSNSDTIGPLRFAEEVAPAPKLLCDEMLQRLGRWLRAAGYDTLIAEGGKRDRDLLAWALRESRRLITRDRKFAEHRGANGILVVLRANNLEECVAEITEQLEIDWLLKPFTRCVVCNAELTPLPPSLLSRIPHGLSSRQVDLHYCPLCWKIYWSGGHVDRMRTRLEGWRKLGGEGRASGHHVDRALAMVRAEEFNGELDRWRAGDMPAEKKPTAIGSIADLIGRCKASEAQE